MTTDVLLTDVRLSEAACAARAATQRHPALTRNGFGDGAPLAETPEGCECLATALAYLRRCEPTRKATKYSYGLKHRAEHWGRAHGGTPYVANGDLIAAALYLGLRVVREGGESPNAGIGVSARSVAALVPPDDPVWRET